MKVIAPGLARVIRLFPTVVFTSEVPHAVPVERAIPDAG